MIYGELPTIFDPAFHYLTIMNTSTHEVYHRHVKNEFNRLNAQYSAFQKVAQPFGGRTETHTETRTETRAEARTETRAEVRTEARADASSEDLPPLEDIDWSFLEDNEPKSVSVSFFWIVSCELKRPHTNTILNLLRLVLLGP